MSLFFEQVKDLCARFTFSSGVSVWKPRLDVWEVGLHVQVQMTMWVPHRETGQGGDVVSSLSLDPYALQEHFTEQRFKELIYNHIRRFIDHEILESVRFDGELVNDPHPPEVKTTRTRLLMQVPDEEIAASIRGVIKKMSLAEAYGGRVVHDELTEFEGKK